MNNWFSVDDILPEKGTPVLVYIQAQKQIEIECIGLWNTRMNDKPKNIKAFELLVEEIYEISSDAYSTTWYFDIEHVIYDAMRKGHNFKIGQIEISREHLIFLKFLSERCGGWCISHDWTDQPSFVAYENFEMNFRKIK